MRQHAALLAALAAISTTTDPLQGQSPPPRAATYGPLVLSTSRSQIVIADSRTFARALRTERTRAALAGCAAALRLTPQSIDSLLAVRPFGDVDTLSARANVVFGLLPILSNRPACSDSLWSRAEIVAHGLRLATQPVYSPIYWPMAAELRVGDSAVAPGAAARAPIVIAAEKNALNDSTAQFRLSYPIARLVPRDGEYPLIQIHVRTGGETPAEAITIPASALDSVWSAVLDRAAESSGSSWRSGRTNSVETQLRFARRLQADGDSAGARVVSTRLLRQVPCLGIAPEAAERFGALFSEARSPNRCDFHAPVSLLGIGLLAPGLGHFASGRTWMGRAPLLVTAGLGGYAASSLTRANSLYRDYQAARSTPTAVGNYQRATNFRAEARTYATAAASVWALSALEAAVAEWRHRRYVQRVGNYREPQ